MSSIAFQDEHEDARVGGRERAHGGYLLRSLFDAIVDLPGLLRWDKTHALVAAFGKRAAWGADIMIAHDGPTLIAGAEWEAFLLSGNTALAIGSDELRFVARVHCQCEVHGFVEGPDRAWLAGLVEGALRVGVLREETQGYGKGWRDVIDLLRRRDDCPVAMSYSVTDGFPNCDVAGVEHTCTCGPDDCGGCPGCSAAAAFDDLPTSEQWAQCMRVLREERPLLRMQPSDWQTYRFDDGRTAFDLRRVLEEIGGQALKPAPDKTAPLAP